MICVVYTSASDTFSIKGDSIHSSGSFPPVTVAFFSPDRPNMSYKTTHSTTIDAKKGGSHDEG